MGRQPDEAVSFSLDDRYTLESGRIYLTGLQALVRLPLDIARRDRSHGRRTGGYITGYEGSPLGGYDLELARRSGLLDDLGVVVRPALNEEIAANGVQGTQLASASSRRITDGVFGIWYGKAPGLDRATDALRHGTMGGADPDGGVLVLVGDDPSAKSSTIPSSSEQAIVEIGMPLLSPSDPQDILDLGLHGIELSRFSGLWVGMRIATTVADGAADAVVSPDRVAPTHPDATIGGTPYRHRVRAYFLQPVLGELERTLTGERLELARRYAAANGLNRVVGDPGARVGIITAGAMYLEVRQALADLGLPDLDGVRVLKLGLVHPLVPAEIIAFAEGLDEIIVVEEKRPVIELAVKDVLYGRAGAPAVSGRRDPGGAPLLPADGSLDAAIVAGALRARLSPVVDLAPPATPPTRTPLPLMARTPYFCSGCPHNRSTRVPEGSVVGAGIGCHTLALFMPGERVGDLSALTQMGGEGAPWLGMAPFVEHGHLFQNIGDGTFHHSGSLAVRAAVASGESITYKILYNSAVAMTGGQRAVGEMQVPQLAAALLAEGVRRVTVTTEDPDRYRGVALPRGVEVRHRDRLEETQVELAAIPGVTVLINDQACATELRRKRKRGLVPDPPQRAFINQRVCEGCGDCGQKSNCMSVQPVMTEFGRKTTIHQASCNKDYSCIEGDCPSFLVVEPATTGRNRPHVSDITAEELPEPAPRVNPDDFAVRITGIGGTGVVTITQVLATAAAMTGRHVRALDQIGLAQKGGAVVSDLKVSAAPLERSNRVGSGQADLYLGCDLLVAATEANLASASPERTVAVVSTTQVPTGSMVLDPRLPFPTDELTVSSIRAASRDADSHYADTRSLALDLFGDDQFANMLLVGVAHQAGTLPIAAESIESAIALNGVAVARNVQAFRRGRQLVADPESLRADIAALRPEPAPRAPDPRAAAIAATVRCSPASPDSPATPGPRATIANGIPKPASAGNGSPADGGDGELAELVLRRVDELIAYQGPAYAQRYADEVERVRAREAEATGTTELTRAVARHLYQLMAYKDEYEVARLSLDPALDESLRAEFGEGYRATYRLHPPMLRALGVRRKLSLGRWFRAVFALLYALRFVRGTPFDLFGYAKVRRVERALVGEYVDAVSRQLATLAPDTLARAVQVAELPDLVRGYEDIKLRNVERYRAELARVESEGAAQSELAQP